MSIYLSRYVTVAVCHVQALGSKLYHDFTFNINLSSFCNCYHLRNNSCNHLKYIIYSFHLPDSSLFLSIWWISHYRRHGLTDSHGPPKRTNRNLTPLLPRIYCVAREGRHHSARLIALDTEREQVRETFFASHRYYLQIRIWSMSATCCATTRPHCRPSSSKGK
jgi:hypothetical protein